MPHGYSAGVTPAVSLAQYTIVMWYGTLATIPTGWQICDGTGGTPDLRNYFVKGASAGLAGDNTAHGNLTHMHTGETSLKSSSLIFQSGVNASATTAHFHTVETDTQNHEPPYKHLVFIMKS